MDKFGRAKISCHVCSDRHEDTPCIQVCLHWLYMQLLELSFLPAAFGHSPPSHFPVILARWQNTLGPVPLVPAGQCKTVLSYSPGIYVWCFTLSCEAAQSLSMGSCCILWGSQSMCWPSLGAGGFQVHLQRGRPGAVSFLCPGLQLAQHFRGVSPTQPSAGLPLLLEDYAEGSYQSCTAGCVPVMGWVPCAVTKYPAALASSFLLLSSFIPLFPSHVLLCFLVLFTASFPYPLLACFFFCT